MIVEFSAERQLLEASKSAELIAAFKCIEEADAEGQPRFSPAVVRELGRMITCRTYGPVVHELCHLAGAALVLDPRGGYERLFWSRGPVRPARFAAQIAAQLARPRALATHERVRRTDNGIAIAYDDGSFAIAFTRMPVLAVLIEFLGPALGYGEIDRVLRPLGAAAATKQTVSAGANALSRLLYDYLKAHLPSAQTQRKFHALTQFLERRRGADFDAGAIADDDVLAFWLDDDAHGQADFKTFLSVYKGFVWLVRALDHAAGHARVEGARAIGADRAAGEVEPDDLRALADAIETETRNPLEALAEPPAAAIKFVNGTERRALALLAEAGPVARRLPLSQLRAEVFAPAQDRMVEAQRRRAAPTIAAMPYGDHCASQRGLIDHLKRMMLAALHVLSLRPAADAGAADASDFARALGGVDTASAPGTPDSPGADHGEVREAARRAYRAITRQGFGREAEPEIQAGFAAAAAPLAELKDLLRGFLDAVEAGARPAGGVGGLFDRDQPIFAARLRALHGAATGVEQ